jgi:hypothetical protein
LSGAALFIGGALLTLAVWLLSLRFPRYRQPIRSVYSNGALPIWVRNGFAMVPLWSLFGMLFGSFAFLPLGLVKWVLVPIVDVGLLAFVLAYRSPPPLFPRWLAAEVREGRTLIARARVSEWVFFWVIVPIMILGNIAIPLLIFVFHEGPLGTQ